MSNQNLQLQMANQNLQLQISKMKEIVSYSQQALTCLEASKEMEASSLISQILMEIQNLKKGNNIQDWKGNNIQDCFESNKQTISNQTNRAQTSHAQTISNQTNRAQTSHAQTISNQTSHAQTVEALTAARHAINNQTVEDLTAARHAINNQTVEDLTAARHAIFHDKQAENIQVSNGNNLGDNQMKNPTFNRLESIQKDSTQTAPPPEPQPSSNDSSVKCLDLNLYAMPEKEADDLNHYTMPEKEADGDEIDIDADEVDLVTSSHSNHKENFEMKANETLKERSYLLEFLDTIFFGFLAGVVNNDRYTDSQGNLIHHTQTLKKSKMQLSCPKLRADQDPFQNFKFRINAFKNAFFEEAKRIGTMQNLFLPLLTPRSIKEYVDSTPYIAKFVKNHKIKSKGYECYQVDGQLFPDRWVFRVFRADFSETTPPTAYCGELYFWEPIISDPKLLISTWQLECRDNSLPDWLEIKDSIIMGTAPSPFDIEEFLDPNIDATTVQYTFTLVATYNRLRKPTEITRDFTITLLER